MCVMLHYTVAVAVAVVCCTVMYAVFLSHCTAADRLLLSVGCVELGRKGH